MKYIMLKAKIGTTEKLVPIIFPDFLVHSHIEETVRKLLETEYKITSEIYSAGEINVMTDSCHGRSSTLEVESNPDDANTINGYDYLYGIIY